MKKSDNNTKITTWDEIISGEIIITTNKAMGGYDLTKDVNSEPIKKNRMYRVWYDTTKNKTGPVSAEPLPEGFYICVEASDFKKNKQFQKILKSIEEKCFSFSHLDGYIMLWIHSQDYEKLKALLNEIISTLRPFANDPVLFYTIQNRIYVDHESEAFTLLPVDE